MQMIDTSVVRVYQHGACIADNDQQDMGRSRGLTSRIHAVVDCQWLAGPSDPQAGRGARQPAVIGSSRCIASKDDVIRGS
jgi:hypothetical protein